MTTLTVQAQQALAVTQVTVSQATSVTEPVTGASCNTLITTQSYSLASSGAASFSFINPLISNNTAISATIASSSSTGGNPSLTLSGQEPHTIWLTVTNQDPVNTFSGTLNIPVLIFHE
jgi:hypothetical protein